MRGGGMSGRRDWRGMPARLFGDWVREVGAGTLRADALAGLLGCLLVLPQGVAFATLAGLPPQYGLYSAVVPCVLAALFGSSRHCHVGAPLNANSLALFAVLAPLAAPGSSHYVELALAVTVLVGLMQLTLGLLRLGALANFISPSALFGFTSGAAVLIALYALKDALGLPVGGHGLGRGAGRHRARAGPAALGRAGGGAGDAARGPGWRCRWDRRNALHADRAWRRARWRPKARAAIDPSLPLALLGPLSDPWPAFHVPDVSWRLLPDLLGVAVPLAIWRWRSPSPSPRPPARSGQHIDPSREFIEPGRVQRGGRLLLVAHLSCGSLNRSVPNYEAGARTPLASVFSALLLVALVAATAPWLARIPHAAIAGLLLLVAASLFDLPRWRRLARVDRGEALIAGATLAATVLIRMEVAILLGALLSLMAYLHRTSRPAMRVMGFDAADPERHFVPLEGQPGTLPECPQLKLLRMEGSVYFGAAAHVAERLRALRAAPDAPRHLLVMGKSMNFVDHAGAEVWEDELRRRRAMGGDLYFHRPRPQVMQRLGAHRLPGAAGRGPCLSRQGHGHPGNLREAGPPGVRDRCTARCFRECGPAPGKG